MGATHVVGKPFHDGQTLLQSGQEVDASGYRNLTTLVRGRFLKPLPISDEGGARFCVVLKPFQAGRWTLRSGELVDTLTWPNTSTLIGARFLRRATEQELSEADKPPISPDELEIPRPADRKKGK